jgi:hypothetical protein
MYRTWKIKEDIVLGQNSIFNREYDQFVTFRVNRGQATHGVEV